MEIYKAQILAAKLMAEHGVKCPLRISRGKRTLGTCHWKRGPDGKAFVSHISLSSYLILLNDEAEVRETMLHEIAHALVGHKHGHDIVWKLKAIEIGASPSRLAHGVKMPEGKFAAVCPRCKEVVGTRHRRSRNMNRQIHRACGTRVIWVSNCPSEIDRAMESPIPEKKPTYIIRKITPPDRIVNRVPVRVPAPVDEVVEL